MIKRFGKKKEREIKKGFRDSCHSLSDIDLGKEQCFATAGGEESASGGLDQKDTVEKPGKTKRKLRLGLKFARRFLPRKLFARKANCNELAPSTFEEQCSEDTEMPGRVLRSRSLSQEFLFDQNGKRNCDPSSNTETVEESKSSNVVVETSNFCSIEEMTLNNIKPRRQTKSLSFKLKHWGSYKLENSEKLRRKSFQADAKLRSPPMFRKYSVKSSSSIKSLSNKSSIKSYHSMNNSIKGISSLKDMPALSKSMGSVSSLRLVHQDSSTSQRAESPLERRINSNMSAFNTLAGRRRSSKRRGSTPEVFISGGCDSPLLTPKLPIAARLSAPCNVLSRQRQASVIPLIYVNDEQDMNKDANETSTLKANGSRSKSDIDLKINSREEDDEENPVCCSPDDDVQNLDDFKIPADELTAEEIDRIVARLPGKETVSTSTGASAAECYARGQSNSGQLHQIAETVHSTESDPGQLSEKKKISKDDSVFILDGIMKRHESVTKALVINSNHIMRMSSDPGNIGERCWSPGIDDDVIVNVSENGMYSADC